MPHNFLLRKKLLSGKRQISEGKFIIMGIDPGLNATGYGIIQIVSDRLQVVTAGAVRPSPRLPIGERLLHLYDGLSQAVTAHQPGLVILESLFTHHQYLTTAALMAHARGIACVVGAQHGLEIVEYLPTRIKKALTGYGSASKEQVARAVGMWLGVDPSGWSSDATDALALAIAHAHIHSASRNGYIQKSTRSRNVAKHLASQRLSNGVCQIINSPKENLL
ncbi:MAG: crossover junction endodeoxyribonuclease RuvC [Candidatus Omnitrophica bacterium]|nr:crossover junction endodeoxyribonuclease RuvC [Candidatus Omnitrophota bacterium]